MVVYTKELTHPLEEKRKHQTSAGPTPSIDMKNRPNPGKEGCQRGRDPRAAAQVQTDLSKLIVDANASTEIVTAINVWKPAVAPPNTATPMACTRNHSG